MMPGPASARRTAVRRFLAAGFAVAVIIGAVLVWRGGDVGPARVAPTSSVPEAPVESQPTLPAPATPETLAAEAPAAVDGLPPLGEGRGYLALVLDDLGHNLNGLTRRALDLPGPVTFAVLPALAHSDRALTEIERAGKPAFLHLPMEPEPGAGSDAGEPQIRVGALPAEIHAIVEECLDGLPGVVGVNNHMGSRATASRPEMDAVMEVLAARGLPFLDSQTTALSVAHVAAARAGVPVLRNDIFVDVDTEDPALVLERLDYLVGRAQRRGWAVGIGHVNEATVTALEIFLPTLEAHGVELVGADELIRRRAR